MESEIPGDLGPQPHLEGETDDFRSCADVLFPQQNLIAHKQLLDRRCDFFVKSPSTHGCQLTVELETSRRALEIFLLAVYRDIPAAAKLVKELSDEDYCCLVELCARFGYDELQQQLMLLDHLWERLDVPSKIQDMLRFADGRRVQPLYDLLHDVFVREGSGHDSADMKNWRILRRNIANFSMAECIQKDNANLWELHKEGLLELAGKLCSSGSEAAMQVVLQRWSQLPPATRRELLLMPAKMLSKVYPGQRYAGPRQVREAALQDQLAANALRAQLVAALPLPAAPEPQQEQQQAAGASQPEQQLQKAASGVKRARGDKHNSAGSENSGPPAQHQA